MVGCVSWFKRDKGAQRGAGQPVSKTASGVPFNQDLDSARGPSPEDPESPKEVMVHPEPEPEPETELGLEPDHAPAGPFPVLVILEICLLPCHGVLWSCAYMHGSIA